MSVIVCQRGARHRYAVPRLLHEAGLLTALYTDSCDRSLLGKFSRGFSLVNERARKLGCRSTLPLPYDKVFATDNPVWRSALSLAPNPGSVYARQGLRGAKVVYSMMGNEPEFLEFAKAQGASIILDVFIHPYAGKIMEAEATRYPWATWRKDPWNVIESRVKKTLWMGDVLLAPSGAVAKGIAQMCPELEDRIELCPYGSSFTPKASGPARQRDTNRILFAGSEYLRKGLHYFAMAASEIKEGQPDVTFAVAGLSQASVPDFPGKESLEFLGKIPLDAMQGEFERATLFCLPSLAEGQAGVVLEAMGSGCPVVATSESGVDFHHGEDGWRVPARDSGALVVAFETLLKDQALRDLIAAGARERFKTEFSLEAWGRRLEKIVRSNISTQ